MSFIARRIENHIEDYGPVTSPDFKRFHREFKVAFNNELEKIGATLEMCKAGHYYIFGFFKLGTGDLYYYSISDVRHFPRAQMMYRTAKHLKDWTGGTNQFVNIEDDMVLHMKLKSNELA